MTKKIGEHCLEWIFGGPGNRLQFSKLYGRIRGLFVDKSDKFFSLSVV